MRTPKQKFEQEIIGLLAVAFLIGACIATVISLAIIEFFHL